jgi:acyl-CoA synthetase (AMP-forming)/AMP-acid ligase II
MPLTDQLRLMADAYPGEIAYRVLGGPELSFAQWEGDSNRLARALVARGVRKGDRVAVGLPPEEALRWLVAYAAVHKAGAVAVPLNPRLAEREVAAMLGHSGTRALVAAGDLAAQVASIAGELPLLELVVVVGEPTSELRPQTATWSEMVVGDDSTFQVEVAEDDLADILYTSGTTGTPKGVAVRHKSASLLPTNLPSWSGEIWLHSSPLFTFAGVSFVYNPMKLGMSALYQPRFDADEWLDAVESYRPTAVFLVPAMAQLLVKSERFETALLDSVKLCAIGSAPLAPATLRRMQDRMPSAMVSNSYGMTEAGAAYCAMPEGESLKRVGSVGKPMPPMEVRCVDAGGSDVPAGEVGEVLIRLPGKEREYFGDPEATARTWEGGWLHTGDLGRLDEDGYLYITGRKKDVIIRGGNNIHATDVESVLLEHPDIAEAAVVGVPHDVLGEDLAAFVVPVAGSRPTPDELRRHCLAHLAEYKAPRRFVFAEELPRNATGKVQKHLLEVPREP